MRRISKNTSNKKRLTAAGSAVPTFFRASGPIRQQFLSHRKQTLAFEREGRAGNFEPFSVNHSSLILGSASQGCWFCERLATHTAHPHNLQRILERLFRARPFLVTSFNGAPPSPWDQQFVLHRVHFSTFERAGRERDLFPFAMIQASLCVSVAVHAPVERPEEKKRNTAKKTTIS